jgi:hypothetical protein
MSTKIYAALLTVFTVYALYFLLETVPGLFLTGLAIGFITVLSIDMYKFFITFVEKFKNERKNKEINEEEAKPTNSQ